MKMHGIKWKGKIEMGHTEINFSDIILKTFSRRMDEEDKTNDALMKF